MRGKLIIFSAPSGSGKTTLVRHLMSTLPNLVFSVSATSRQPRPGEIHGQDYYFFSPEEMQQKIENNEFLEWEEVYKGTIYGTLKQEVENKLNAGRNVIFDVDVVGGLNIKKEYKEQALAVFVKPPSVEELKNRLQKRSSETTEQIDMRVEKAEKELNYASQFDRIIMNTDLKKAKQESLTLVKEFIS